MHVLVVLGQYGLRPGVSLIVSYSLYRRQIVPGIYVILLFSFIIPKGFLILVPLNDAHSTNSHRTHSTTYEQKDWSTKQGITMSRLRSR